MEETSSINKDQSILTVSKALSAAFGPDFFDNQDFWEADLFAIGFRKGSHVIYVSTWDNREDWETKKLCFYSFDLIDEESLETIETVKEYDNATIDQLVKDARGFLQVDLQEGETKSPQTVALEAPDRELLELLGNSSSAELSFQQIDGLLVQKHSTQYCSANGLIGPGLSKRVQKLIDAGVIEKTAPWQRLKLTARGTKLLSNGHAQ
jgi:hypothetical protein